MDEIKQKLIEADPFASWWPFIAAGVVFLITIIKNFMGGDMCPNTNTIDGQVVVVTGGNGGIGKMVCQELCNRKGYIIIAGKDTDKMEKIKCALLKNNPIAQIEARYLDLRSFDCIQRFVKNLENDFPQIDVLINNAGIMFSPYEKTVDDFEAHLQVNYLGHFYLTALMMSRLLKQNSRVVNVSCHAYLSAKMTIDDPLNIGKWAPIFHARDAFSHSKACVMLATKTLSEIFKPKGITVNSCTPGLVRGTGQLASSVIMKAMCARLITYPWMWLFMKTPTQGAQVIVHLATDPKYKTETGGFYNDCQLVEVSELVQDKDLERKLFKETMRVLNLDVKTFT